MPLSSIIETPVIHQSEIVSAHQQRVIDFRGQKIPLVDMHKVFDLPEKEDDEYYSIVIVKRGDKMAGLIVDSFIGQQEFVLKSLGNYLTNIFAISVACILLYGEIAVIFNSNAILE